MSAATVSSHIPDIDLITVYAERNKTYFSRVSPWTKFAFLILIVLFVTVIQSLMMCAVLYAVVLLVYAAAGLPLRRLFAWYALPVFFVISLVGIMAWSEPGIPVFTWNTGLFTLTLTDNGILLVITLLVKTLITVTYSLFFLMTTRYQYLASLISRIFPAPLDQIFLMAYRFLFLPLSLAGMMLKAVRSRGGGILRSLRVQGGIFAEVFALVFIRSFDRADRVHLAMTARGYQGKYWAATKIPVPGLLGYGVIGASVLIIALLSLRGPVPGWW